MKIPAALEQMVAGLISDERAEKERVEAVLSQIHKLTADFYDPVVREIEEQEESRRAELRGPDPEPVPAPPITQERLLENAINFNMRRGDDKNSAEYKAKKQFGIED